MAIGADRRQVVRQLLTETALLFLAGGAAGLVIARLVTALLVGLLPALPIQVNVSPDLDWRVFFFAAALSLGAAMLTGVLPARHASRANVTSELSDEAGGKRDQKRLRHGFVVAQIALATMLVVAGGLLGRALAAAASVDLGYDPEGVELASFNLSLAGYTPETTAGFSRAVLDRLSMLPGVRSASVAATVPMGDPLFVLAGVTLPGAPPPSPGRRTGALGNLVEPGYFRTLGIPLAAGRDFGSADREGTPAVAIVGEATARRLWPGADAVGKQLVVYQNTVELKDGQPLVRPDAGQVLTVVGVARDVKYASLAEQTPPLFVYIPLAQQPSTNLTLLVRGTDGTSLTSAIRRVMTDVAPNVPITTTRPLTETIALALMPQRMAAILSVSMGLVGTFLAAFGIYGVVAYAVALRTREIGIRLAVGADRADVALMVLRHGTGLALVGIATGLLLAAGASRILGSLLFGVSRLDPIAFGGSVLLFATVTLIACLVPMIRATRVDPVEALRHT
jgi:putative ABC transport system permease protein